jgi:hypothetical protein
MMQLQRGAAANKSRAAAAAGACASSYRLIPAAAAVSVIEVTTTLRVPSSVSTSSPACHQQRSSLIADPTANGLGIPTHEFLVVSPLGNPFANLLFTPPSLTLTLSFVASGTHQ